MNSGSEISSIDHRDGIVHLKDPPVVKDSLGKHERFSVPQMRLKSALISQILSVTVTRSRCSLRELLLSSFQGDTGNFINAAILTVGPLTMI